MGFPFAPSEVVMRREWAFKVGLFDETLRYHGEDPDFHTRLALAGCEMVGVDRILNYRRLQAARKVRNLALVVEDEARCQDRVFEDPRCPAEVRELRATAAAELALNWAYVAWAQDDTAFALELVDRARQSDPRHVEARRAIAPKSVLMYALRAGGDHDLLLRRIWRQLPASWRTAEETLDGLVADGYALRAIRDIIWLGQPLSATVPLSTWQASSLDEEALDGVLTQLMACCELRGRRAADTALRSIVTLLDQTASRRRRRMFAARHAMNMMFRDHHAGEHREAVASVMQTVRYHPGFLASRNMLTIGARSMFAVARTWLGAKTPEVSTTRRRH
jgi:hypothetical protein